MALTNTCESCARRPLTEHTDRTALENLLQAIAKSISTILAIHQETKQQKVEKAGPPKEKRGAPDYKVTKNGNSILGYVECKPINWDLNKVLKSDQIRKTLSENIIVTDYLKFVWISKYGAKNHTALRGHGPR